MSQLAVGRVNVLSSDLTYDASVPVAEPARAKAKLSGTFNNLTLFGRPVAEGSGEITYDNDRLGFDAAPDPGRRAERQRLGRRRRPRRRIERSMSRGSPWCYRECPGSSVPV